MEAKASAAGASKMKVAVKVSASEVDEMIDDICTTVAGVDEDTLSKGIMERTAPRALEMAGIAAAGSPEYLASRPPHQGEEFCYDMLVTAKPLLALSSYGPVSIQVPRVEVSDDAVDARLMQVAQEHAVYEQVAGRTKVSWGDAVALSSDTTVEGGKFPPLCFEDVQHELGDGRVPSGFDAQLVGMESGTEALIEYEVPSNRAAQGAKPRTARSAIKVGAIYRKVIPAMTDAWVKQNIEGAGSLEAYRAQLRSEMVAGINAEQGSLVRGMCADALAARLGGPVPQEAIEPLENELKDGFRKDAERLGMTYEAYLEAQELSEEDVDSAVHFQAQQEVAVNYALDALASHLGLGLDDADIEAFCEGIAPGQAAQARASLEAQGRGAAMREGALREKALRYLVENAHIEEIDPQDWDNVLSRGGM